MNNNNNTKPVADRPAADAAVTNNKSGTWGNYANAGYELNQIPKTEVLYRRPKKND